MESIFSLFSWQYSSAVCLFCPQLFLALDAFSFISRLMVNLAAIHFWHSQTSIADMSVDDPIADDIISTDVIIVPR